MTLEVAPPLDLAWDILKYSQSYSTPPTLGDSWKPTHEPRRVSTYEKGPDGFPVKSKHSGESMVDFANRVKEEARMKGGSGYGPARPPGTGHLPGNARHDSAKDAAPPPNVDMSTAQTLQTAAAPRTTGEAPTGPTTITATQSPTSTVGSPAAASTTAGSGVGIGSTGATCGSCGMMTGGGACGNTACATNAGKGLFGTKNQQGNGQTGVQVSVANENQEDPGAGVPEQRSMEQKIRDISATAGKNFTEDMGFGQRVATAGKQVVDNMRGADGSLQTGLGLNMQPVGGFNQKYVRQNDSSFQNPTGWWEGAAAPA